MGKSTSPHHTANKQCLNNLPILHTIIQLHISETYHDLHSKTAFSLLICREITLFHRLQYYFNCSTLFRNCSLRAHKFTFQWSLIIHFVVCTLSLLPFAFTGQRDFAILPICIWTIYNVLFFLGSRHPNKILAGFLKARNSFKLSMEEVFSIKLLPLLSISFLLVALSLAVTGHKLGGPPLCYQSCGACLAKWDASKYYDDSNAKHRKYPPPCPTSLYNTRL